MFCPTRSSTRITRASQTSQEWLRLPKVFRLTGDCCQQDLSEVFEDSCGRLMLQASLRKAAARAMRFICRSIFFCVCIFISVVCIYALCNIDGIVYESVGTRPAAPYGFFCLDFCTLWIFKW
jgi:hypothetical protein